MCYKKDYFGENVSVKKTKFTDKFTLQLTCQPNIIESSKEQTTRKGGTQSRWPKPWYFKLKSQPDVLFIGETIKEEKNYSNRIIKKSILIAWLKNLIVHK